MAILDAWKYIQIKGNLGEKNHFEKSCVLIIVITVIMEVQKRLDVIYVMNGYILFNSWAKRNGGNSSGISSRPFATEAFWLG